MIHRPFNKIALLLFILLIPVQGLACSSLRETVKTEEVKDSSPRKYTAALGSFQPLKGTPYLMAAVTSLGSRADKFSSYESYDSGGKNYNLVFLNTNSLESHRLFDTNNYVILQTDQFTQKVNRKEVTQWLVHQVLKADTDNNKQLDQNDLRTLGISSASGKQYVEVLTGITQLFGLTMSNPGTLVVVYGKNNAKIASVIDLNKRTIIVTKAITDLGAQVK